MPKTKYLVVDALRRPVSEPVNTPSRAQFLQKAFSAAWPGHIYEIKVVSQ